MSKNQRGKAEMLKAEIEMGKRQTLGFISQSRAVGENAKLGKSRPTAEIWVQPNQSKENGGRSGRPPVAGAQRAQKVGGLGEGRRWSKLVRW
jgi:hypothetical protein